MEDVMYFPGGWQVESVSEWGKHLGYFKGALSFGSWFPRGVVEMKVCCL